MNCSAMSWAHRHAHGFLGVMLIKNLIYLKAWTKICFIEVAGTFTEGMFFPPCCSLCVQMSMSVNGQASVAPASATTPSGTTPASALWITCRSTEGTTAWVGRLAGFSRLSLSYLGLPATLHFSHKRTTHRHEEELLLQELLLWQRNVRRRAKLQHDQKDVLLLLQHRPCVEQTLRTVPRAQQRWGLEQ